MDIFDLLSIFLICILIFKQFNKKISIILSIIIIIISFVWKTEYDNFSDIKNENVDNVLYNQLKINREFLQNSIKNIKQEMPLKDKLNIPVYYINLDKSTDRKDFMEKQFKDIGITNYHRVPGVNGSNITDINIGNNLDGVNFINLNPNLSKSEVGCTLAHLKAIRTAYENNEEYALIMEDDCSLELLPFWKGDLKLIINNNIPKDWEIAQLFTFSCQNIDKYKEYSFNNLPNCKGNSSCVYVINKKGMETILNNYYDKDKKVFIVTTVADIQPYQSTKTYFINIPLFIPLDDILPSTIHTSHQNFHVYSINNILIKYIDYVKTNYSI